ncbi:oxysterol-binding protein-related protein 5-like isoform X1 [Lates japonicus]|uniref:Oxysterol-binding protein-related protein 5-like isoform X1 n=1 Tax=Lates japonicus TaxID=270547 RepID=A0AAD3MUK6_LATJO|nr:oxysterol-binding protein-related protein 5-like isoform X1 [Lates japonicus]
MDRDQLRATQEKFIAGGGSAEEGQGEGDKPWIATFHQDPPQRRGTLSAVWFSLRRDGVIQALREKPERRGLSYSHSWASQQKEPKFCLGDPLRPPDLRLNLVALSTSQLARQREAAGDNLVVNKPVHCLILSFCSSLKAPLQLSLH